MVQPFVVKYLRNKCSDVNEKTSDNDDGKDDDDDDTNSEDAKVVEINTGEALRMLDRLVNLK